MSNQFEPHTLTSGAIKLSLLPYGLTFHSLIVNLPSDDVEQTISRDLLIGYSDPSDHHYAASGGRGFRNQTVGRYANRLPSGTIHNEFQLDLIANEGTAVTLHGGAQGVDTQAWTLIDRRTSTLFTSSDSTYPPTSPSVGEEAIYRLVSKGGADGFPLTLEIEGLVVVRAAELDSRKESLGKVTVALRAKIVEDETSSEAALKAGTPVNLTVHWGFNLDEKVTDCKNHKLYIDSSKITALDELMLATGKLDSTKQGDALNFEQGSPSNVASHRTIGEVFLENGLDHNIVFNSVDTSIPKVVLSSSDAKLSLEFITNQSTVQAYTACGFDGTQTRKVHHQSADGRGYEKFGATFLEFHHPLATFLHPELTKVAGTDTILKVGEVYENFVEIDILYRA